MSHCNNRIAIAKQLCDALRCRIPYYATYWVNHAMTWKTWDEFSNCIRGLSRARVQIRISQHELQILDAPWSVLPLRICGADVCRFLHALLILKPCPFRINVESRTYQLHYTHFAYDSVVDNYFRREELIKSLGDAIIDLFVTSEEKSVAVNMLSEMFQSVAISPIFATHPLNRCLRELALSMRETK